MVFVPPRELLSYACLEASTCIARYNGGFLRKLWLHRGERKKNHPSIKVTCRWNSAWGILLIHQVQTRGCLLESLLLLQSTATEEAIYILLGHVVGAVQSFWLLAVHIFTIEFSSRPCPYSEPLYHLVCKYYNMV